MRAVVDLQTRCTMRYFFADPSRISGSKAVLEGAEAAHIKNVLRLRRGDQVGLVDGTGYEFAAVIERIVPGQVELTLTGRKAAPGRPAIQIHVAQGCLKEKKMDRSVRQLSELGVARWTPFICERATVRPEANRVGYRQERWRRIAVDSLKQCRRGDLMIIEALSSFERVLEIGRAYDVCILFWEKATQPPSASRIRGAAGPPSSVMAVLGPEGGFSDPEVLAAEAAGFVSASLGPRILRAETAAVCACAIVQYVFGDIGPGKNS
jgi:16S rRNA (uracil1498-N3)-methyltransferase